MRTLLWSVALVLLVSGIVCEFVGGRVRDRYAPPMVIGGVCLAAWLGVTTP